MRGLMQQPRNSTEVHQSSSDSAQQTAGLQVPRSSKQITEDNDYILFRVILFRRVADTFKAACRQSGYQVHAPATLPACHIHIHIQTHIHFLTFKVICMLQVREYEVDEEKQAQEDEGNTQLSNSAAEKKRRLEQWSTTAYGEVHTHPSCPLPAKL